MLTYLNFPLAKSYKCPWPSQQPAGGEKDAEGDRIKRNSILNQLLLKYFNSENKKKGKMAMGIHC